jgi:N-acyl-D-aspartate/D-glutamate deacylase
VLDLVISNGLVVDGTGASSRIADVGITGGRIVEIGEVRDTAHRTIDAAGKVVAPGFIDVHTHFDAQVFWDSALTPSPLHGVTTVFGGNCGFTIAPINPDAAGYLMRMLARVEGMPLAALETGVPWDWRTTAEYFDRIDGTIGPNAGFMVGHSTVRRVVMGEAASEREATEDELEAMRAEVRASLAAGAMGFSSTASASHNDAEGRPVPSRHASYREYIELARVCGEFPGTSLELIPHAGPAFPDEKVDLMIKMSAAAGRPLNWNLLVPNAKSLSHCEGKLRASDLAREQGAKLVGLVLPMDLPIRVNFYTGFVLDMLHGWEAPMSLPFDEKMRLLSSPDGRARLDADSQQGALATLASWGLFEIGQTFTPETAHYQGRLVGEIAATEGKGAFDALADIVCADGLKTTFFRPAAESPADRDARESIIRDPRTVIGGSDAGAHLDGVGTFNFGTRFISEFVRDDARFTLEEAIQMITGDPAALYGLVDRGTLRPGAAADVVVFDLAELGSEELWSKYDLPSGAPRLYANSTGIEHVLVNGESLVEKGELTDARPGTMLRSGRDTHSPSMA